MQYTTPPAIIQIDPGWRYGLKPKLTVALCGSKGDDAVIGVAIDRKGRVVCQISSYQDDQGCVHINICDKLVKTTCPK